MKEDVNGHLKQDRITRAVIDEAGLASAERDHLEHCPVCAAEKQRLAAQLRGLSVSAEKFTPAPRLKIALPASEPATGMGWIGRWYTTPAAVAVCLALFIALFWPHLFTRDVRPYGNVNLMVETAADAKLLAEVHDLEASDLPVSLAEIAPDPGVALDTDEDFLDFMTSADAG
jgi:hypothetical protein